MVSYLAPGAADIDDAVVLILIVVEDGLVQTQQIKQPTSDWQVLILIVVENGLVHQKKHKQTHNQGLNPYCSGRWSRTFTFKSDCEYYVEVLILIVVEDGLVQFQSMVLAIVSVACLNPYCSGRWSRTFLKR